MLCLLPTLTTSAYARLGPSDNATAIPTPEQLDSCKTLGIEFENCSDTTIQNAILAKYRLCLGPNCGVESAPTQLDLITTAIMIGCGIALVAGVFSVRKLRKVRKRE